jgi:hypothetical protein
MKVLAKMRKNLRNSLTNKRGQGATEYILLLVVVVGLVMIFKGKIMKIMNDKVDTLGQDIDSVKSNN